jgi:DNA-binding NtrC family response regulator
MPLDLQPKILRFLQEHTMRRVGGGSDRHADVRVMAATHRDLESGMADGSFRRDLYYRLNTIPVVVPPLRQRLEDLPELCDHLVAKIARRLRRQPLPVSDGALSELAGHSFPGNVRELENLLERAMVLGAVSSAEEITAGALAIQRETEMDPAVPMVPLEGGFEKLNDLCQRMEADLIRKAIAAWPGLSNRELAERLGTNRRVLELRMKDHGIVKGS